MSYCIFLKCTRECENVMCVHQISCPVQHYGEYHFPDCPCWMERNDDDTTEVTKHG